MFLKQFICASVGEQQNFDTLIQIVRVPFLLHSDHPVDRAAGEIAALTVPAACHEKRVTV